MSVSGITAKGWIGNLIDVGLLVAVLIVGIGGFFVLESMREPPQEVVPPEPVYRVKTAAIQQHAGGLTLETDGVVVPYRQIELAAEVGGRIVQKADVCRAGYFVPAGTLLLQLDDRDYRIQVRQLEEDLEQAANALVELQVDLENTQKLIDVSKAQLELQRSDFQRLQELHERGVVTDAEFDQARRTLLQAESSLLQLENQYRAKNVSKSRLEAARDRVMVMLEKARLDLERTKIVMPVDGVVVQDMVEQDSYVRAGTPVVMVEDTSAVEVKCSFRTDQISWIWPMVGRELSQQPGDRRPAAFRLPPLPARVTYEVGDERFTWTGRLARYENAGFDELTRMVPCRIRVDDPFAVQAEGKSGAFTPPALVRGMFVSVEVQVDPQRTLWEIPEDALRPGDRVGRVRNGFLKMVSVQPVDAQDGMVIVLADSDTLRLGDRVAVSPTPFLENAPLTTQGEGIEVEEQEVR
ncbi:hypothetical protein JCM19992_22360 [Thermostilla marina]